MVNAFLSGFFFFTESCSFGHGLKDLPPSPLAQVKSQNCLTVKCDDATSNRTDGIRRVVEDGSVVEWVKPNPLYLQ